MANSYWLVLLVVLILPAIHGVDVNKFRKCEDSDFCKRNRDLQPAPSVYSIVPGTVKSANNKITADITNSFNNVLFAMEVSVYPDRVLRLKVDEKNPIKPRYP